MSDHLRIALVSEGPTDAIVIQAALSAILLDRAFVLTQLQPEGSVAFGKLGTGWSGVYRWCKQAAQRGGGRAGNDEVLFQNYHLLILHLDADVATATYGDGDIKPDPSDLLLPCDEQCPPPSATTNALRRVLMSWCGEDAVPARTIAWTPSQSTEAWVMATLFPDDVAVQKGIECFPDPESRLGQQPKGKRIRKRQRDYSDHRADFEREWARLAESSGLDEARRFQREFLAATTTA